MPPLLAGRATSAATRQYCLNRGAQLSPRGGVAFGLTELCVSGIGFGGYRLFLSDELHYAALALALRSGVNVVDTSANYGDGQSESLIGRALGDLVAEGAVRREEIIIVTKGGYLQGQTLALAREREAKQRLFQEVVKVSEECWHCIHPDFLSDQIQRSRERMGVECIDIYLLHNPEYFLETAIRNGMAADAARLVMEERLALAFAFLEGEVAAGRIGGYGLSSNGIPTPADDPQHISLERCWELARRVGQPHHFHVAEFPGNLLETGAWTQRNQAGRTQSALEFAAEKKIAVLLNRPLNAIVGDRLIRLADPPADLSGLATRLRTRFQALKRAQLDVQTQAEKHGRRIQSLDIAERMEERFPHLFIADGWQMFFDMELGPLAREALQEMDGELSKTKDYPLLRQGFLTAVNNAFQTAAQYAEAAGRPVMDFLRETLDEFVTAALRNAPLSQKATWILRSLPGAPVVLVGMRHPDYVKDVLELAAVPPSPIPWCENPSWLEALWTAQTD